MAEKMAIMKDSPKSGTRKRERITMLERRPDEKWFVANKTPNGRTKWYLRFTITGAFPRLFGPFLTKRKAILFLDNLHNTICEFWTQVDDVRDRYANEGEFEKVNWGPIIEHPLAMKGR